ncbi:MAG: T9SS type A sorting domain-containing protein [Bacteroidetes bacterium]|nr:MAG: T9SS type A sorting domain-containing protein [Bacteroidota bacterium]
MNQFRLALLFVLTGFYSMAEAQYTQAFQIKNPQHGNVVHVGGDKSQNLSVTWTSGKVSNPPVGVNYFYKVYFDSLAGDVSSPLSVRDITCCQSSFNDTSFTTNMGGWASYLNGISKTVSGKDFKVGDTLTLNMMIDLMAVDGLPNYEFRSSDSIVVKFVRTQFSDEYTPFDLQFPQQDLYVNIGGNPNTMVNFTWQNSTCPAGCAAPEFYLMIDTVNDGFQYPYTNITVPFNGNSWSISYNSLNQIIEDCGIPEDGTKTVYWTVMATGPGKTIWANQVFRLHLTNKMLNNENHEYSLLSPVNNTTITLKGAGSQQISYQWESTYTPVANSPEFYLVFDTAEASPIFGNPVFQFKTKNNGIDSAHSLSYGYLKHALDSAYGKSWGQVNLMWTAKALLGGNFYYAKTSFNLNLIESFIISADQAESASVQVYPNPAQDHIRVSGLDTEAKYSLYDATGKQLSKGDLAANGQVSLSDLPSGLYWLELQSGQDFLRKQVVVRR